jgi:hypothetical protein
MLERSVVALSSAVVVMTVAVMTWAARVHAVSASIAAAALFAAFVIVVALRSNAAQGHGADAAAPEAARTNARVMSLIYGWGGLAMLAIYTLSGLPWHHGWQYGTGMLVIALGLGLYARQIALPASTLARPHMLSQTAIMALLQGIAAGVALIVLFASGKAFSVETDWAANHVFVAGGVALVVASVLAYTTHQRLAR